MKKRHGDLNDNRGFSLIELIITIMVMAILMIALAPQVMKWVNNARISTDVQLQDSIMSNVRLALADPNAYNAASGTEITLKTDGLGTVISSKDGADISSFITALNGYFDGVVFTESSSGVYESASLKTQTEDAQITVFVDHGLATTAVNDALANDDLGTVAGTVTHTAGGTAQVTLSTGQTVTVEAPTFETIDGKRYLRVAGKRTLVLTAAEFEAYPTDTITQIPFYVYVGTNLPLDLYRWDGSAWTKIER